MLALKSQPTIIIVLIKSQFCRLEPTQDAGGWPAVFRLVAERQHGLNSSIEILQKIYCCHITFC